MLKKASERRLNIFRIAHVHLLLSHLQSRRPQMRIGVGGKWLDLFSVCVSEYCEASGDCEELSGSLLFCATLGGEEADGCLERLMKRVLLCVGQC